MIKDTFKMHNGVTIPAIGFGTWQIPNEEAHAPVTYALKHGYTHIDTARGYQNEENVGKAIHDFDIAREDVFITSKLPAEIKGYQETLDSFEETMSFLDVDYLDLYLIHAPCPWSKQGTDHTEGNIQTWKAMEKLYNDGRIRSIGVSNFEISDIQALIDNCDIVPMVNQIVYYAGRDQKDLIAFCKKHDIVVEAYSPLATGQLLNNPVVKEIADRYDATPAQVLIRYCLQNDTLPLPKSTNEGRIIQNKEIDFVISDEDMQTLENIEDVRD